MNRRSDRRAADPAASRSTPPGNEAATREPEAREAPIAGDAGAPAGDDEIRREAYYRYLRRDGASDDEIADWLDAEAELRARGRESLPGPPAESRP
jgi:hypothetical protein